MSEVDENGRPCFTFIWKIMNFNYCMEDTGEEFSSPTFYVDLLRRSAWEISLHPRGESEDSKDYISLYLYRNDSISNDRNCDVTVDYEFSIVSKEGNSKHTTKATDCKLKPRTGIGRSQFISRNTIVENNSDILPEGVLTIKCRIWMVTNILVTGVCMASTTIGIEHNHFLWTVDQFSSSKPENNPKTVVSKYPVEQKTQFELSYGSTEEDNIDIKISQPNASYPSFAICCFSYFKSSGDMVSVRDHHWFEESKERQVWSIPSFITRKKLAANKEIFLPSDKLVLLCEYSISFGVEENQIESVQLQVPSAYDLPVQNNLETVLRENELKCDLKALYEDKTLCDANLRVGSDVFPVHKAILCARSSVFKAMLTSKMKENATDSVDIKDLDSDTVKKMLSFIYTDAGDDLTWNEALKLYFAADKYELLALQKHCSSYIKSSLCVANALEAVDLAEMHSDDDLKEYVRNFIFTNVHEVIRLEEWEKFVIQKSDFAAKMLNYVLKKKLGIVD